MSVTPLTQASKLLDFGMKVLKIILDRQANRVEDAYIASKPKKDTGCFESKKPRIRTGKLSD
jgi:hypothetical protein